MNPIKNNGNYFIKDAEISDTQHDKFKHMDVAKNIINIIENNSTPFNIAIVGKWGLGKSSLINMVKVHLERDKSNYIVEDVNAWKYEKEALKRVLLRKTLSNLGYNDKNVLDSFLEKLFSHKGDVGSETKTFWQKFKSEWIPLLVNALILYVIGVVLTIVGQIIIAQVNFGDFDFKAWFSFVLSGFASNFYIPLVVVLFQKFINTSSGRYNFKVVPPITTTDEYELQLENLITRQEYKNKKIVIIVDDLDRLTPNKIVEALDAIKAFVGYSNFVFIVPFDDTILQDAIKKEKTNFIYNEHLTIESDLFLDKLFQYRITLPSVIQSNMAQYAIDVSQKDALDLVELCGESTFDLICKEILIHKKVSTPRQAKKIINTFANNLLLGYRRECNGVVEGVFTSLDSKRFLAKVSVLQSDFPLFYSNLFVDNTIIDKFLSLTDSEEIVEKPNELLLPYFDCKGNEYSLNKSGESLSLFLHRTASITSDNVARFLYLNDDRLSEIFGNEFSLSVRDGLSSGAYRLVREKLDENSDKDIANLLYEVLSNSDPIEFEFCCVGIINVSDIDVVKSNSRLLSLLNDRLQSIFISQNGIAAKNLNIKNAVNIFKIHKNFKGIETLLINQIRNEQDDLCEILSVYFSNEEYLTESIKYYIKELISEKCSTEKSKLNFDNLFNIESLDFDLFFGDYLSNIDMFNRLFDHIVSEEIYDEKDVTVAALIHLYKKHCQSNNSDKVLNVISSNLANVEFATLFIDDMIEYADKLRDKNIVSLASNKLIEAADDDIRESVNTWLSKVNWKILSAQSDTVDKYLMGNFTSKHIDSMLLNVSENNQVKLIPKTIKNLHAELLKENVNPLTIATLQQQYSTEQNTDLFEMLKLAFSYTNSDDETLNFATNILMELAKESKNKANITQVSDYIYTQNSNYPNQMISKISKLSSFKKTIETTNIQKFIGWARTNISSYPMNSTVIYDTFKAEIVQAEYASHGDVIMSYATVDTLEMSLSLLAKFRTEFKKGTEQLKKYKTFLIEKLTVKQCRKSIMKDITDYFSSIEDVNEFISEVIKYDDIIEEAIVATIKFTETYNEEQISHCVKRIIETSAPTHLNNANKIFSGWLKEKYSLVLTELLENTDSAISVSDGINLLQIVSGRDDISSALKVNLISIMLEICDDTMLSDILLEVEKIGKLSKNSEKRQLGAALYNAFRNTAESSNKKQLASLIKLVGVKSSFEMDEQKNKREFSEEEKELLKHNK